MGGQHLKFNKNPRYTHHRSEGLTHRARKLEAMLLSRSKGRNHAKNNEQGQD